MNELGERRDDVAVPALAQAQAEIDVIVGDGKVGLIEAAGLRVIQIDEPALREGLPLRAAGRDTYLDWAVECFRLASAGEFAVSNSVEGKIGG